MESCRVDGDLTVSLKASGVVGSVASILAKDVTKAVRSRIEQIVSILCHKLYYNIISVSSKCNRA